MFSLSQCCGSTSFRLLLCFMVICNHSTCVDFLPGDPVNIEQFRQELLVRHNNFRASYGLKPLRRNQTLESFSEDWVAKCWGRGQLVHSHYKEYGENIAWRWNDVTKYTVNNLADVLFNQWSSEINWFYNGLIPDISTNGRDAGHVSQILWAKSTDLGCSIYSNSSSYYLSCNYWPPGNILGQKAF